METEELISIVVPIYNVEIYLEKCIETILNQTYKNIEIILVDDGSTDSCKDIADEYVKKDKRIKVIHKENGGLSDARNAGIKIAKGRYICFVDSDDYIEKNYIKILYETIIRNNADISICSYKNVYIDGSQKEDRTKTQVCNNIEAIRELFTKARNIETVTWNKMYKIDLFLHNKIEFPKGKLHEDNFTTYKLFYFSNKIAYVDEILYNYRQRENSIVSIYNEKRLVILEVTKDIRMFFEDKEVELTQEIQIYDLILKLGIINMLIFANKTNEAIFDELTKQIRNNKGNYLKNKYLGKKQKISIKILGFNKNIYIFMRRLYKK